MEEYLGDLMSLESLTKSIVTGSAAAAKVLFLNNPNGTTNTKRISTAETGAIVEGNAADVTVLQVNKFNDFRVAMEVAQTIEQRLSQAFLLMSSLQRNAERVTAEEIRQMVADLEASHGGVYANLQQELQLPLIKRFLSRLTKAGKLPELPKDTIKPVITTGLDALGRGQDIQKLDVFVQGALALGEAAMPYLKVGEYLNQRAIAQGLEAQSLIYSEAEVQQAQQQSMLQQTAMQAAPGAINEVTKGVVQQGLQDNSVVE